MAVSADLHNQMIPPRAGIGLRAEHFEEVIERRPDVGWFEAHSENYFSLSGKGPVDYGSKPLEYLEQVRLDYPVSLHGVGLSIGSTDPLNRDHLKNLWRLVDRIQPGLVSEHLSWGSVNRQYFNDLLPLPYTEEALDHMVDRVGQVQDFLGRQILIENLSSYLEYKESTIPEWEFISSLSQRSGCGILLDVNNIFVNAMNHGFDAAQFLSNVPVSAVKEIHLAGHTVKHIEGGVIRLDTHDQRVCNEVWDLYRQAMKRFGDVPALIEWDRALPELDVLLAEAERADHIRESVFKKSKDDDINVMKVHEHVA